MANYSPSSLNSASFSSAYSPPSLFTPCSFSNSPESCVSAPLAESPTSIDPSFSSVYESKPLRSNPLADKIIKKLISGQFVLVPTGVLLQPQRISRLDIFLPPLDFSTSTLSKLVLVAKDIFDSKGPFAALTVTKHGKIGCFDHAKLEEAVECIQFAQQYDQGASPDDAYFYEIVTHQPGEPPFYVPQKMVISEKGVSYK